MQHFGFNFSISENSPLFTDFHFKNDATWKYKEMDKENLMNENNAKMSVFVVRTVFRIEYGI